MNRYLIIFAMMFTICACGNTGSEVPLESGDGSGSELPSDTNNTIQVGNPPIPTEEEPDSYKALVIEELQNKPYWLGSSETEEEVTYAVHFDTEGMTAELLISSNDSSVESELAVNDDGSIEAIFPESGVIASSPSVDDEKSFELNIKLTDMNENLIVVMNIYDGDFEAYRHVENVSATQFGGISESCITGACDPE